MWGKQRRQLPSLARSFCRTDLFQIVAANMHIFLLAVTRQQISLPSGTFCLCSAPIRATFAPPFNTQLRSGAAHVTALFSLCLFFPYLKKNQFFVKLLHVCAKMFVPTWHCPLKFRFFASRTELIQELENTPVLPLSLCVSYDKLIGPAKILYINIMSLPLSNDHTMHARSESKSHKVEEKSCVDAAFAW